MTGLLICAPVTRLLTFVRDVAKIRFFGLDRSSTAEEEQQQLQKGRALPLRTRSPLDGHSPQRLPGRL